MACKRPQKTIPRNQYSYIFGHTKLLQREDSAAWVLFSKISHAEDPKQEGKLCPWLTPIAAMVNGAEIPSENDLRLAFVICYSQLWHTSDTIAPEGRVAEPEKSEPFGIDVEMMEGMS